MYLELFKLSRMYLEYMYLECILEYNILNHYYQYG